MRRIVIITGHTCNGKTKLAELLSERFDFTIFKTSKHIKGIAQQRGGGVSRADLKELGDELDDATNFDWILSAVSSLSESIEDSRNFIVIDSIRKVEQLDLLRKQRNFEVTHIHLYASRDILEKRFLDRQKGRNKLEEIKDSSEIDLIKSEDDIDGFKKDADVRISTDRTDAEDTLVRVAAYLGLYPSPTRKCVDVLVGGQYGSEGKGQVAAYLSREYDVLMRVGGPNAGHKVAGESGKYTYHSLPSGCRDSDAHVLIGPGATIYIPEFIKEIEDCGVDSNRVFLDPNAMIITDDDREQEKILTKAIGSTGRGGGAAAARRIMGRLGDDAVKLARDYDGLKPYVKSTQTRLQEAYAKGERILLEGTQGAHLSLYHGQYPYVTSRDTNVAGCLAEAGISPGRVWRVLMVVRFTPIRVQSPDGGSSGNLKHETSFEIIAKRAGIEEDLTEQERTSTTNLNRRVGWFEWEKFRQACELNAPTDIILTFADYQKVENRSARRFEQLQDDTIKFVEELERVAQAPVSLINTRFPHKESDEFDLRTLIDRRHWRTRKSKS